MSRGSDSALRAELHYGDRIVSCFPERPAGVFDMLEAAVRAHPDADAVIAGDTRLSYADFDREVARWAAGLARRGVGAGDRIALLLGNGAPFAIAVYAASRLGAVIVPINVREQRRGVLHAIVDSGARVLIAEADSLAIAPSAGEAPTLELTVVAPGVTPVETIPPGFETVEALAEEPDGAPPAPRDADAVSTILYTSGTTGVPKGAMLTELGIVHSASVYRAGFALTPADRIVAVAPLSHVTGLVAGLHAAIRAGGALIIEREFKAPSFLDMAERERMTVAVMTPAMYNLCLLKGEIERRDLAAWRIGGFGGAPMPAPTIERFTALLPGLGLSNCYGATETTSPVTMMPSAETAARRLSVGLAVPGAEIRVMDEAGRECPPGVQGELWHRGPMVVPGYWRNPTATAREFVGGFWRSGDIGSKDADGFIYVHDRKKDVINRGGYKIYSAEIESLLQSFPEVAEAAVVARPCPVLGERPHAIIVARETVAPETIDLEALADRVARELADYKRPDGVTVLTEPLPRNANGKIQKNVLRERLGFVGNS